MPTTSTTTTSNTTIVITILLLHTLLLGGCHENVQTIFRSPLLVRPRGTAIQVVKDRILCGELIGKFNKIKTKVDRLRALGTAIQVVKDRILCGELIGKCNKTS